MKSRRWLASAVLLLVVLGVGAGLAAWKRASIQAAVAAAANQPEPAESIVVAIAEKRDYTPTVTAVGTVVATRWISLRNELAGTVRKVSLEPGTIVESGAVLVALDTSVEQAEMQAQRAQAALAESMLARTQTMSEQRAMSEMELDRARADRDVALAQIARTNAVIERKTIRAPFRARVGIADVHPGQYLEEGTALTTLQGVGDGAFVDFSIAQQVAAELRADDRVEIFAADGESIPAKIVAVDARVDPSTRNAMIRARIEETEGAPSPGASVRVRVAAGAARTAVVVPANALRKGPSGDHVFVVLKDDKGQPRSYSRPVRVSAMLGDEVVIEKGLNVGEQVAASGSFKLREAALVAIIPEPAAHANAAP